MGECDEAAVGDRRRAVVQEQRAIRDVGDLEVRHLRPSAASRVMTRPLVVCTSSSVVAFVTLGVSATALTVIVAVTTLPPDRFSVAERSLNVEGSAAEEVRGRGELQTRVRLSERDEAAGRDRRRAVVQEQRAVR